MSKTIETIHVSRRDWNEKKKTAEEAAKRAARAERQARLFGCLTAALALALLMIMLAWQLGG